MSYSKFIFKCISPTRLIGLLFLLASAPLQHPNFINKSIYNIASISHQIT